MLYRSCRSLVLSAGLLWSLALTAAEPSETLRLEQAVDEALAANPSLAELQSRAAAAGAIPDQAAALPDPVMSLNLVSLPTDSFDFEQEAMTQFQVGLSQRLPWFGKRDLQRRVAEAAASGQRHALAEARLMVARDVRRSWWQIYFIDRAITAIEDNRRRLRQFVEVARAKYRVGEGLQQDVLLAEVELSGQLQQLITRKGQRSREVARLNSLLNRPAKSPLQLPAGFAPDLTVPVDLDRLLAEAEQVRPLLASRQSAVTGASEQLALARKGRYPDFNLVGSYGYRDGENPDGSARSDLVSVGVSFNLPIYLDRKQNRTIDQRGSELQQQRYALDDSRRRVREEVERAWVELSQARDEAELLRDAIIPQTEQAVASLQAGYGAGSVEFNNLIKSQVRLNGYRTAYWQAYSRAHQAHAALVASIGKEHY